MAIKIEAAQRLQSQSFTAIVAHIEDAQWQAVLNRIQDPSKIEALDVWKHVTDLGLFKHVNELFKRVTEMIQQVAHSIGAEVTEIIDLFRTKPMLAFLKAIRFSLKTIVTPLREFSKLYKDGILKVFEHIHQTKAFQKIHSGAMKIDEFLDEYPVLRRLAGPAVAGLLIWMWLSGNFTGNPELDMDLSAIVKAALAGQWSVADLFTSKQGLAALGLLFTGLFEPWPSPAWLSGGLPYNALVALCYTAYKHVPKKADFKEHYVKLKTKIKFGHL